MNYNGIQLEIGSTAGNIVEEVSVFSSDGRLMLAKAINEPKCVLNVDSFSGLYFIQVTSEERTMVRKMMF